MSTEITNNRTRLIEVLANLTHYDSSQGVWVDFETFEYRFGQFVFENGGVLDGKHCIGALNALIDAQLEYGRSFQEFLSNSDIDTNDNFNEDDYIDEYWDAYQEQYLQLAREWADDLLDCWIADLSEKETSCCA